MLAHRASYDKKTLARQVIPLAPGYRTALSSRPALRGTKILFCGCGLKWFSPLRGTKILFCGCGLKWFSPLRGTKILFCGCGLKCFSPLRGAKILFCGCGLKMVSPSEVPILTKLIYLLGLTPHTYWSLLVRPLFLHVNLLVIHPQNNKFVLDVQTKTSKMTQIEILTHTC